jgi:hypothetical protein
MQPGRLLVHYTLQRTLASQSDHGMLPTQPDRIASERRTANNQWTVLRRALKSAGLLKARSYNASVGGTGSAV